MIYTHHNHKGITILPQSNNRSLRYDDLGLIQDLARSTCSHNKIYHREKFEIIKNASKFLHNNMYQYLLSHILEVDTPVGLLRHAAMK